MKVRDRGEVYDRLCVLADRILSKHSVCATCPVGCAIKLPFGLSMTAPNTRSWCCSGCKHLGPNGCTVKALACKLWLCSKESDRSSKARRKLDRLVRIAAQYNLLTFRGSREESLELVE